MYYKNCTVYMYTACWLGGVKVGIRHCKMYIKSPRARSSVRARICKLFKEPRSRFPAWWAGTTTLFDIPARQATQAGGIDSLRNWFFGIDSWALTFTNTGSECSSQREPRVTGGNCQGWAIPRLILGLGDFATEGDYEGSVSGTHPG
jgi:hypothetical protein